MTDEGRPKGLKKVSNGKWWDLGPAMLYRDDVEKIYGLFAGLHETVDLRLGGYELTSLADIAQVPSTMSKDLKISFYSYPGTYASFEAASLRPGHFGYYAADQDDLALVGLCEAIRPIVYKRRLWPHSFTRYYLMIAPSWLLWIIPKSTPTPLYLIAFVSSMVLLGLFMALIFVWRYNEVRRNGRVVLRDSTTRQSFPQAHHDLMLVLLGSALTLITTIVGGVVVYLILFNLGMVSKP